MKLKTRNPACLVLEGGGVKCSYQYGALRTLVKIYGSIQDAVEEITGGDFMGIAGSSYGAVNSALILQGGMEGLEGFWDDLSAAKIFKEPRLQRIMEKIYRREKVFDAETALFALSSGLDPLAKQREISKLYFDHIINSIDEEAVRSCGLELGLTAVELANFEVDEEKVPKLPFDFNAQDLALFPNYMKFVEKKLVYLTLEDIPEGELPYYVAASAAFPAFRPMKIRDRFFTDGGVLDNIPVRLMALRGYTKALVIRTGTGIPERKWEGVDVKFISPSRELGAAAVFSVENIHETIALGEYDAEEAVKAFDVGGKK